VSLATPVANLFRTIHFLKQLAAVEEHVDRAKCVLLAELETATSEPPPLTLTLGGWAR